jgi:hypothetical protein
MNRLLTPLSALAVCAGCGRGDGGARLEREVYFECPSPAGGRVAVFYREFGGGAAGSQYEHVEVRTPADHARSVVLTLKGAAAVRIEWTAADRVRIEYPDSARVDHWQSWFGPMADGHVELSTLRLPPGARGGCIGPAVQPSIPPSAQRSRG